MGYSRLIEREMRGPREWEQAFTNAKQLYKYDEYYDDIIAIGYMGIDARKELLKISRCQRSLQTNYFLRSRTPSSKETYRCPQDS